MLQAPNFTLKQYQSVESASLSDYQGKMVMLTFWTSWCPDSIKDLHQKQHFYQSLENDDLVFLTVNVTGREGKAVDGAAFIEKNQYTFPVLFDEGTKTYDAYRCFGVPTTFLLNEEHEIVSTYNDRSSFFDVMQGLGTLLKQN